jgi:hypothetical protein
VAEQAQYQKSEAEKAVGKTSRTPVTKEEWGRAAVHTITLPSGAVVKIKLPDLAALIKGGQIPNPLLEVAQKIGAGEPVTAPEEGKGEGDEKGISKELIGQISDFHSFLVSETVVEPTVTQEEVESGAVPTEDIAVIVQFALRERDFDVVGHHLGGLEKVTEFRKFRGLDLSVEDILGSSRG